MPTILTVDDTCELRTAMARLLRGSGFEVMEASNGAEGLELLRSRAVDLILLDVVMPEMDGPTMLRELRARGDRTPVILVTSESSRRLVAGALPLGIADFVLKPFRPDGLRAKIARALAAGREEPAAVEPPATEAPPAPEPSTPEPVSERPSGPEQPRAPGSPATDLLVIDDMEQVHRRLRSSLPEAITMHSAIDAMDALIRARHDSYRLVLLDLIMPGVDSVALLQQLRALQPQAVFLAITLRTAGPPREELQATGFADRIHKPFGPEAIEDLLRRVHELRGDGSPAEPMVA